MFPQVTYHPRQRSSGQLRIVARHQDVAGETQLAQPHIERTSQAAAGRVGYHGYLRKFLADSLDRAVRGSAIDHDNLVLDLLQLFALRQQRSYRAEQPFPAVDCRDDDTEVLSRRVFAQPACRSPAQRVELPSLHTDMPPVQLSERRDFALKVALPTHALLRGGFLKRSPVKAPGHLLSRNPDLKSRRNEFNRPHLIV